MKQTTTSLVDRFRRLLGQHPDNEAWRVLCLYLAAQWKADRDIFTPLPHQVRLAFDVPLATNVCFACRSARATQRHHIVAVENGGQNSPENIVGVCRDCHAKVHLWRRHGRPGPVPVPAIKHQAPLVPRLVKKAKETTDE